MICEIAHAPRKIHETNWRDYVQLDNRKRITEILIDPRPAVLISAHYGNFELAGYITGLLSVPTFSIARTLDNPYLDRYVNFFRESKGQFIVDKQGSALQIDSVLSRGGKLAFLGDQHAGPKGCWVEFFGRQASCHKAIAVFPLTAGAPLAVFFARRIANKPLQLEVGMTGYLDPALAGAEMGGVKPVTQWYNRRLEEMIREMPEQYWWVHRRWREQPKKGRAAAENNRAAA
jgi:KDO2-lipid IV(A) lauroyltransferase